MSITDATVDTDTSNDTINDNDNDNDNNRSNERIDHGIQTTYGDRNGLRIINYCDDEESNQITSVTKKPIYNCFKDAYMNNNIIHGRDNITHNITHAGSNATNGNNPPVTSE